VKTKAKNILEYSKSKYLKSLTQITLLNFISFIILILIPIPKTDVLGAASLFGWKGDLPLKFQLLFLLQPLIFFLVLKKNTPDFTSLLKKSNEEEKQSIIFFAGAVLVFSGNAFFVFKFYGLQIDKIVLLFFCMFVLLTLVNKILKNISKSNKFQSFSLSILLMAVILSFRNLKVESSFFIFFTIFGTITFILFILNQIYGLKNLRKLSDICLIIGLNFILYSSASGKIGLHPYESFPIVNLELLNNGGKPFKDFSAEHGIWEDLIRYEAGSFFGGDSLYGVFNGISTVIRPLEISIFYVAFYLFSRSRYLTFVLAGTIFISGKLFTIPIESPRMTLLPLICYFLYRLINEKDKKLIWSVVLGTSLGILCLFTNEAIYPLGGILFVLFYWIVNDKANRLNNLLSSMVTIFMSIMTFVIPLLYYGILDDWLFHFLSVSDGYFLAWGSNIDFMNGDMFLFYVSILPLALLAFLYVTVINFTNRSLSSTSLSIIPLAISSYAFFVKFIHWPDWHIGTPFTLLLWATTLYVAARFGESTYIVNVRERGIKLLGIFIFGLTSITVFSNSFEATQQSNESSSILRSTEAESLNIETARYAMRIDEVVNSFKISQKEKIFDFGNEPVGWYYLAQFEPAIGETKVLNAYSRQSQNRIVQKLNKDLPNYVIWGGENGYWEWPFNGTWMRQYFISQYLLEKYDPIKLNGEYILMRKKNPGSDISSSEAITNLRNYNCDWSKGLDAFRPPKEFSINISSIVNPEEHKKLWQPKIPKFDENDVSRNAFYVRSNVDTWVKVKNPKSISGNGTISFWLSGDNNWKQVWLAGCPTWKLQEAEQKWVIEVDNSVSKVQFATVE
jgi:hypothetical protein